MAHMVACRRLAGHHVVLVVRRPGHHAGSRGGHAGTGTPGSRFASYHEDPRHAGLARRAAGRIHHAQRQPAEATRDLLAAAALLGAVDVRLARDTLIEAAVEAQINGQFAPDGATRADVARAAQALPLTPG